MPGMCGVASEVLYFDIVFDHAFGAYGVWNGSLLTANGTNATGPNSGVYLTFNLPAGGPVLARAGLSYVSVANAQANLAAESPASAFNSAGFSSAISTASNNWNAYLNKIQVNGGTVADTATFYTMMYHALQAPEVVSDVNGEYMGFDGKAHTLSGRTQYGWFSGWDIYRSECQFIAMMDPARAGDMAQSLVQDATDNGAMPRWPVAVADSGIMMGDPATPVIAGMYAFGATNINTAAALAAMVRAAVNPATKAMNGAYERDAERDYLNLGFVPENEIGGYGPVSMTLEYCSADFALGQFAQSQGDTTNYTLAMNRAQNWRNHFNTGSGYLQLRRSDSLWSPGFNSSVSTYDKDDAFVEGTGAQYVWMVPFNLASLTDLMGGPAVASSRLDTFFTELNDNNTGSSSYAYMGNEPCSETPWIYSFLGEPYKTSAVVRQIITQLYSTAPGGLPGNDDLGQMSSWYVFAALGMYPELPGDDVLILNGPLFPQAVIHLTNGDVTITGGGAGDSAPYVQNLMVNGQASSADWIRFGNIANGGTLAFSMGTTPNTNWGANPLLAPPSYTDGMTAQLAQNYLWGTGLEANETQIYWTNTVDTGASGGGISNVGPITGGVSGPELGVRSENSQSGTYAIMYSGAALGGVSDYAYMAVFNLSGQNVTISPGMRFSYWIFPQSPANNSLTAGSNSAYAALDLIFTDGTNLRNSGLTNQFGVGVNPANQGGVLALDTWNYVTVDLTPLAGKAVNQIDFGYSQPGGAGGYRGYVDDLGFTTPAGLFLTNNLALNQPASTDSQQANNPASYGNDGNTATCWSANDGNTNHWWQVDLGGLCNLTGDEVLWPMNGVVYDYTVAVSLDNTNWAMVVDKTANTSPAQDQVDVFIAAGRYVRITITGLPLGDWASFGEFRAYGSVMAPPPAPTRLNSQAGYTLVNLNWTGSVGATSYSVKRSTSSGTETNLASVTATNYVDKGLSNGTTYYYVVSAQNVLGQSGNSGEAVATPMAPVPGSYAAAVVADGPLAYWPLNETNGSEAFDIVGGNDGTYVGGVTLGQPGVSLAGFGYPSYAALLDGTSGYVDIPDGPFNITNAITTIAWVNVPVSQNFSGLIGHGDGSWRLSINASGDPGAADGSSGDATSPISIVGSGWHMVAYRYTGNPNVPNNGSLYLDGVLVANDTVSSVAGDGFDVWIGGAPDYGTTRLLAGRIAQVSVFTNALSATQELALYNAATSVPATNAADAIFNAFNNAFYVNNSGNNYYKLDTGSGTGPGWWTLAEEIEMAEDSYDRTGNSSTRNLVSALCNGFIAENGTLWTADSYNDDITWAVIAFCRAYLATGNTYFLNVAKSNFDAMFSRGWDITFTGGGLWWNTADGYKNAAVNGPAAIAACYLFSFYGDNSYLSKAEDCYAWERRLLFQTNTGAIYDGIATNNVYNTWASTYNQGTFIGAGNFLYQATGLPFYGQDAILAAKYTQGNLASAGILQVYSSGDYGGFNGIFSRWLARMAKDQNLWAAYGPWLTTNAVAAWNVRNTNTLSWYNWTAPTPAGTNVLDSWDCSDTVVIMQVAWTNALDALQISPGDGFTAVSQYSVVPNPTFVSLVLTNAGTAALSWSLACTSAWLTASANTGTLAAGGQATNVQISLAPSAVTNLPAGHYYTSVWLTNLGSGVVQGRSFALVVASGNAPIAVTGYNARALAPNSATAGTPNATAFDIVNDYCFYEAGLNGSDRGLLPNGVFTSELDETTVFQFMPYGNTNALVLGYNYPGSATLTLVTPQAYDSLALLACSANTSGGMGSLVLNFTNGTHSQALNFNAQDWFNTVTNVAIQGFGRLKLGAGSAAEDDGANNPNLYQTTLNLAALGLTGVIASVTFTKPANAGSEQTTGIFGVSGMASSATVLAPGGLTAIPGTNATVKLSWNGSAGATNYTINRSVLAGSFHATVGSTAGTNYTDTGLVNGATYYYVVQAVGTGGESGNSSEVSATPGAYKSWVLAWQPLAYWPLNETGGTVAYDISGGYNGTYVGGVALGQPGVPLPGFGAPNYAASFDGTSGYVDIPEGPFDITNAVTALAWINVEVTPHFAGIIGHGDSSWRMSVNDSGDPGGSDGSSSGDATSATSIVGSGWHMLAYTYTGNPNRPNNGSLYVDGVLKANDTVLAPAGDNLDVWIGGAPDYGSVRLFSGTIAQAAVFTNVLTAAQVLAIYDASLVVPPAVQLKISSTGTGNLILQWFPGPLLQATNLAGPWTTNTAVSPYSITPTNSQIFFKLGN